MITLAAKINESLRGNFVYIIRYNSNDFTLWVGDGRGTGTTHRFNKNNIRSDKSKTIFDTTEFLTDSEDGNNTGWITTQIINALDNQKHLLTSPSKGDSFSDVYKVDVYNYASDAKIRDCEPIGFINMLVGTMENGKTVINFFTTIKELKAFSQKKFKKVN